ncbi:MAG: DUF481 domain-containing protein [Pseudomonadota bacterium]
MKPLITAIAVGLAFTLAQPATAQWAGEASLTGNRTTGNTDTTDIGLGLKLANEGDVWRHKFDASADYGRANGVNNRERFFLGYKLERDIGDRFFAFGEADYLRAKFGAFTDSWFVGGGLGYTVFEPEPVGWSVSAGAGYRSQTSALDVTEEEVALNAESDFDWQINNNVSLYDDAGILWSDSNTFLFNEIGLTADLMGNLAARASYRIEHNTDVPLGREKTDTITRFGIVYTIG